MSAGFGIGLSGQPQTYTQFYGQRQMQEEAKRQARIKRDDDEYKDILKDISIKPEAVDWKLQPLAQQAVADYTYQVNKLRQEEPLTWRNKIPEIKMQTQQQLANIYSSSQTIKQLRELGTKGGAHVPESVMRWLDTGQGDLQSNLPSLVDQRLYGINIDPKTYHIGMRAVPKVDIRKGFQDAIYSQKDAYQDEVDAQGRPIIRQYGTEQQSSRILMDPFVESSYEGLTTNPDFAQNINIAYANELRKRPDFKEEMIVGPDGNYNPKFLEDANRWGYELARETGRNYRTVNQISKPNVTNISIDKGAGNRSGVSSVSPTTFKIGVYNNKQALDEEGNVTDATVGADVESPGAFTTPNFKVRSAKSGSVVNILNNDKVTDPGVNNAEYGEFAVIPTLTAKAGEKYKGRAVPTTFSRYENGKRVNYTLQEALDKGWVEYKVVGIGAYEDSDGKEKSIYRDASEISASGLTGLADTDEPDFNRQMRILKETATKLNADLQKRGATTNEKSNSTLQSRKGKVDKAAELRSKYKY